MSVCLQAQSIDEEGVYAWSWFSKKRHLWSNFQDKSIIKVKSTGMKVAKFEKILLFNWNSLSEY
jgi:hypothetical protein